MLNKSFKGSLNPQDKNPSSHFVVGASWPRSLECCWFILAENRAWQVQVLSVQCCGTGKEEMKEYRTIRVAVLEGDSRSHLGTEVWLIRHKLLTADVFPTIWHLGHIGHEKQSMVSHPCLYRNLYKHSERAYECMWRNICLEGAHDNIFLSLMH